MSEIAQYKNESQARTMSMFLKTKQNQQTKQEKKGAREAGFLKPAAEMEQKEDKLVTSCHREKFEGKEGKKRLLSLGSQTSSTFTKGQNSQR